MIAHLRSGGGVAHQLHCGGDITEREWRGEERMEENKDH